MKDDDKTPPRGGSKHSLVDVGELAKRTAAAQKVTATEVLEQQLELDTEIKPTLLRVDARTQRMEVLLDQLTKPLLLTPAMRVAGYASAAALVVIALAVAAIVVRSAPAAAASAPIIQAVK